VLSVVLLLSSLLVAVVVVADAGGVVVVVVAAAVVDVVVDVIVNFAKRKGNSNPTNTTIATTSTRRVLIRSKTKIHVHAMQLLIAARVPRIDRRGDKRCNVSWSLVELHQSYSSNCNCFTYRPLQKYEGLACFADRLCPSVK
jgi:hypothetical protein